MILHQLGNPSMVTWSPPIRSLSGMPCGLVWTESKLYQWTSLLCNIIIVVMVSLSDDRPCTTLTLMSALSSINSTYSQFSSRTIVKWCLLIKKFKLWGRVYLRMTYSSPHPLSKPWRKSCTRMQTYSNCSRNQLSWWLKEKYPIGHSVEISNSFWRETWKLERRRGIHLVQGGQ